MASDKLGSSKSSKMSPQVLSQLTKEKRWSQSSSTCEFFLFCYVISQFLQQNLAASMLLPKYSIVGNSDIIEEILKIIIIIILGVIQLNSQQEDLIQAQLDLLIILVILSLIIDARCPVVITITRNTCPVTWKKNCCSIKAERTGPWRPSNSKSKSTTCIQSP